MVMLRAALLAFVLAHFPATASGSPITPSDLVEVAEIFGLSLSPDGRRVAYSVSRPSVDNNSTGLDWYVVDIDGGNRVHVGSGGVARHNGAGVPLEDPAVWDKDSQGIRFLALNDGAVAIWYWRQGRTLRREIISEADILDFALSDDGRVLRYTTGATRKEVRAAEEHAYRNGVLVDDRLDVHHALAGGMIEGGERGMMRITDNWFSTSRILWDAPKSERIVHVGQGRELPNSANAGPTFSAPQATQGLSIDLGRGDKAAMLGDNETRRVEVVRANGTRVACAAAPCSSTTLVAIAARPNHDMLLLFEGTPGWREKVWLWRIGDTEAREVATTGGAPRVPDRPRCTAAEYFLVCSESDAILPPRLVRIDYATGQTLVLDDPNRTLAQRIKVSATPLTFRNGRTGTLLRPSGARGPLPLVATYTYCGGFLKGGVGDEQPMLPLVEHGIAVLCMNIAPVPKGGRREDVYNIALAAIDNAIDELAARGLIDPNRVGIGGLSLSSAIVMWNIRHSKRFAVATISSAQISPFYYWANAVPDRGFTRMLADYWNMGDPETDIERWRMFSAVWDAEAIDTPLLMQLPESEFRTVIELHTKLKRAGKAAELIAFADEVHIKYQPVHKLAVYERNLDWYRFWLTGEEDKAPDKAAQYSRWRSMKANSPAHASPAQPD